MELFFSSLDMIVNYRRDIIVVYVGFIYGVGEVNVKEFIFMIVR